MTVVEAQAIARILQQYHSAFGFLAHAYLPSNQNKTVKQVLDELPKENENGIGGTAFGFATLAFVYAYDCVAKPLSFPADIANLADPSKLNATKNDIDNQLDHSSGNIACMRHLRNCFAHGRFSTQINNGTTTLKLEDINRSQNITFTAECEAQVLVKMAEEILIEAHKALVAIK